MWSSTLMCPGSWDPNEAWLGLILQMQLAGAVAEGHCWPLQQQPKDQQVDASDDGGFQDWVVPEDYWSSWWVDSSWKDCGFSGCRCKDSGNERNLGQTFMNTFGKATKEFILIKSWENSFRKSETTNIREVILLNWFSVVLGCQLPQLGNMPIGNVLILF